MSEFRYEGDEALRERLSRALRRVTDPEMALGIVDLGLVYRVEASIERVRVEVTMTSAACPVVELIVDEITEVIGSAMGSAMRVEVEVVWEPPWTPDRMSAGARSAMAWD